MSTLEQEIEEIKIRNKKVEADKAWETSWTRRLIVLIFTYLVIVIFFYFANLPKPFANAVVPALAVESSQAQPPPIPKTAPALKNVNTSVRSGR